MFISPVVVFSSQCLNFISGPLTQSRDSKVVISSEAESVTINDHLYILVLVGLQSSNQSIPLKQKGPRFKDFKHSR